MRLTHEQTMVLYGSMKNHCISGAGISGFTLLVTLEASENTYIKYPARGALRILEQGTSLGIIVAVFHHLEDDGRLGPPVEVRNPVFSFDGSRS